MTEIAIRSEAYWGYDEEYMEKFKEIYKVTEEYIKNFPVFVLKERGKVIGFYSLLFKGEKVMLEFFYVDS